MRTDRIQVFLLEETMKAVRKYYTVDGEKKLIISDLPFDPGEKIEVVLIAQLCFQAEPFGVGPASASGRKGTQL